MKVLYHVGNSVGADTIVKKGVLAHDAQPICINGTKETLILDDLQAVAFCKINGLGTMVKICNHYDTIYLAVPRLFIDKGTGFAIINYRATKKVGHLLELAMQRQTK